LPYSGYLKRTPQRLDKIISFFQSERPDIIGLIEVDNGSYRSEKSSQADEISRALDFKHVYESKYPESSLAHHMPLLKEQGNALLTNQDIKDPDFHYFQNGIKRLVIELEFESFVMFLVHLSLKNRHRQYQLSNLYTMFEEIDKPLIVAGDFNAFWGDRELSLFLAASGLRNANVEGLPTYPSRLPKRQMDFILHSPVIQIESLRVPHVRFSDHLPLICDFEVISGSS
jgi:endonuclease/exonuclease/phosphatase family metal-dependent hydrolase